MSRTFQTKPRTIAPQLRCLGTLSDLRAFGSGLALAAVTALAASAGASSSASAAAVNFVTITGVSPSPLTTIHIGDEMSFQIFHRTVPGQGQIYPSGLNSPADMGVFARVGSTLFAPNFPMHGGSAFGGGVYTPWTPVSISAVTGNGNAGTPFSYTVTADAGTTGLRLATTVTYLNSENFFRHNLRFTNLGTGPVTFDAFVASDIYLADSDAGIPYRVANTNSVGGQDCVDQTYTVLHIPITPADRYTATDFWDVWAQIKAGDLDNVVASGCIDNGAGLEWVDRTLAPGASITIQSATSFGPIPSIATTHVGVNKDLLNATGTVANEVEIGIIGNYATLKSHFDGGFPSFTHTPSNTITRFVWKGMNVPNNGLVHVGFEVYGPEITVLAVTWRFNGVQVGCARQVNTLYGTHTSGTHQVVYANNVLACEATPLYAGELTVEYFDVAPPLPELNPVGNRSPIAIDVIPQAPVQLLPNQSEGVFVPDPPAAAQFALLIFKVGTSPVLAAPDLTHDFVLLPLDQPGSGSGVTVSDCQILPTVTQGCSSTASFAGVPSATAPSGFYVSFSGLNSQTNGVVFYGLSGPTNTPWSAQSSLCVKAPYQRLSSVSGAGGNTGGTIGQCNGSFSFDMNPVIQGSGLMGTPMSMGQTVDIQAWQRDPASAKTTNMSDALSFVVGP